MVFELHLQKTCEHQWPSIDLTLAKQVSVAITSFSLLLLSCLNIDFKCLLMGKQKVAVAIWVVLFMVSLMMSLPMKAKWGANFSQSIFAGQAWCNFCDTSGCISVSGSCPKKFTLDSFGVMISSFGIKSLVGIRFSR